MELNTVQQIERAIEALTPEQRDQLYQWIECHHPQPIDDQLKAALDAGSAAPKQTVLEEMRALRSRVRPDPEGWTTRDYLNYSRH